jgi:hypothetical protein
MPSLGLPNLQGVYDSGDATPSVVTLDATRGGLQLRGDFATVGTALAVRNAAGTVEYLGVDPINGSTQLRLGNLSAFGPNAPTLVLDGTANTIMLWGTSGTITFTVAPSSIMQYAMTTIHNYANVSFGALNLQGIIEHQQAGFVFNHFLLFNNGNTYRNQSGLAVNFGPGQAFIDQPNVQVNGSVTITMSQLRSFLSQPQFNRTVAGQGTLTVTTVAQVQLSGTITTGCTATTWNRIHVGAFTAITGTVTTYNGILFDNVTGPATIRAIHSLVTAGTFLNHEGTAPCNFGGAINLGSGATVDVTLSRGAANRLDLATGDSFRLLGGNIEFAGTAETISRSPGELLLTAATVRTSAEIEIDGTLDHDGTLAGFFATAPVTQRPDPGALTDGTGGAVDGALVAIAGTGDDANLNNNFADLANRINALRAVVSAAAGGVGLAV